MAREGGGATDDEVSAQTAPNDREVLDPLALLLPAARPSPFGSGERRNLVFLLWRQHALTAPFASDAAYKHSSVATAVSRAIGCASISMAYDLLRLDSTEGVPGRGYRHVEIEAEDRDGRVVQVVT
jgi:hypothetical protein